MDRNECHISAGLLPTFTSYGVKNIEKLVDALPSECDAKTWKHTQWKMVANGIIERAKKFGKPTSVTLGGHSYGCEFICLVAKELAKEGIKVDYMFAIDPTAGSVADKNMVVGSNVLRVDEFWATSGFPHFARKLTGNKHAALSFTDDYDMDNYAKMIIPGGHIACASNQIVVRRVLREIGRVLK